MAMAVTESPSCSMRSDIHKDGTQHLQDQVNVSKVNANDIYDSIDKEEEEESDDDLTFPRFLLAGLQSDNDDLAIQAVHDIAVRVQQMEDPVLQENATWVLERLYSSMDDDKALELLKQEVHVLVIVAAALSTYSGDDEEKVNVDNEGKINNDKDSSNIGSCNEVTHHAENGNRELNTVSSTTEVTSTFTANLLSPSHSIENQTLVKLYPVESSLMTDRMVNSEASAGQAF